MPGKLIIRLLSVWERILVKAKKITLPGFDRMPLYECNGFFLAQHSRRGIDYTCIEP